MGMVTGRCGGGWGRTKIGAKTSSSHATKNTRLSSSERFAQSIFLTLVISPVTFEAYWKIPF